MEPMTEIDFEDGDKERLRRMQSMYANSRNQDDSLSSEEGEKTTPTNTRWFPCRRQPFRGRKSVSEASVYRTCSKYSIKSISTTAKTLDYLMQCFWICSPGCQQTA